MMNPALTPAQTQLAYRYAVQSSLEVFFQKTSAEAESLVSRWWNTLSPTKDIQSGMYLHDEALSTAADLARVREIKITDAVREDYRRIIRESTQSALQTRPTALEDQSSGKALKQHA